LHNQIIKTALVTSRRCRGAAQFKLGRILDEAYAYGCDLLYQELALAVCAQEDIDLRCNHLDTTSFALSGDYAPDSDVQAIRIPHGYSKDHRPDFKQVVLELMVSQDGGGFPL
jgi:transposase